MSGEMERGPKNSRGRWDTLQGESAPEPEPGRKRRENDEPSYYDISMLKPPLWTPEVAAYFFFGGVSAGSFIIARLAERAGGAGYKHITRIGTYVSLLALLPCPPLLIVDLGDPKRFHHMLRVFKPYSPMNLGSWTLTGHGAIAALAAGREFLRSRRYLPADSDRNKKLDRIVVNLCEYQGIPMALLLAGYTGVLLSTTSTPLWCRNPFLGALFSASSWHTGTSAVRLVNEFVTPEPNEEVSAASAALQHSDTASTILEAFAMLGFLAKAGSLGAPLTAGKQARRFWLGAIGAGLIAPAVLDHLPAPRKVRRWLRIAGCALGLVGGWMLRSAVVSAGKESGNDPDAARANSKSQHGAYWHPDAEQPAVDVS